MNNGNGQALGGMARSSGTDEHKSAQKSGAMFNGERNIDNSSYQLFLTKKYNIEKNNTLEKYVINDDVYDTLLLALSAADSHYQSTLDAIEKEQKAREEIMKKRSAGANVSSENAALMDEFGITFDGDKFVYKTYRYDKVDDAINYARKNGK